MERVRGIGGFFFRTKDPKKLMAWYAEELGIDLSTGVWNQEGGPTAWCPFPESTDYFGRPEQQWMLNFRVADMTAMIAQLESRGIAVETRPDEWDSEIGRFARIHDPDGNPLELWEPRGE